MVAAERTTPVCKSWDFAKASYGGREAGEPTFRLRTLPLPDCKTGLRAIIHYAELRLTVRHRGKERLHQERHVLDCLDRPGVGILIDSEAVETVLVVILSDLLTKISARRRRTWSTASV